MTMLRRLLAIVTTTILLLGLTATTARADEDDTPSSWALDDYETSVSVDANGTAHATTTIDFDFADDPGHGPYFFFVKKMPIANDPDHWRAIDMDITDISSPTGAPVDLQESTYNGLLRLRIGDPDVTVRGVQSYVLTYTIRGLVDPDNATSNLDEVNWSVVGNGWQVPIRRASTTLTLPVAPTREACFRGHKFDQPCQVSVSGRTVTYSTQDLAKEEGMQVVAGAPVGTFVNAEPRLTKRHTIANTLGLNPLTGGIAALVALVGSAIVALRVRRNGRDEVFAGLTPGLAPVTGEGVTTGRGRQEVAVAFTPPAGMGPGEVGTLIDERADKRDVTATLVDLAVRGHLNIQSTTRKKFVLRHTPSNAPLEPYENEILQAFFRGREEVTSSDLSSAKWAGAQTKAVKKLYDQVVEKRSWFPKNPDTTRTLACVAGILLAVAGLIITIPLGFLGWGLVGIALIVPGIVLAACSPWMPRRTAAGSAVVAQARGFELYLRTAEADQLRWEEGEDIFSRYLPWAIAFGVADRWTKLFQTLADQGRYEFHTGGWYIGYDHSFSGLASFDHAMNDSMARAASAASSSSGGGGGGSGFSGGGGFGGGGGGGW